MARQTSNAVSIRRNNEGYSDTTFYKAVKNTAKRYEDIYDTINISEMLKGIRVTSTVNGKTTVVQY